MHTDDEAGGRLAAAHLLGLGERSFGFLGEAQRSPRHVAPGRRRLDGFRAAARDAGRDLAAGAVVWTPRGFVHACADAERLLAAVGHPAAIFAGEDVLAAAVLRAAGRAGLRAPEDVAVVGFDDGDLAEVLELTTMRQPLEESGERSRRRCCWSASAGPPPCGPPCSSWSWSAGGSA